MDTELRQRLDAYHNDLSTQYKLAGISEHTVKDYILGEMASAIQSRHWQAWYTLFAMACATVDQELKANILNNLLLMPGHELHQEITREIQSLGSPSSIPYIRQVLERRLDFLQYTNSEQRAIASWFSHALASIGTPESIELIKEFAKCDDVGIAEEMNYRLRQLDAQRAAGLRE